MLSDLNFFKVVLLSRFVVHLTKIVVKDLIASKTHREVSFIQCNINVIL